MRFAIIALALIVAGCSGSGGGGGGGGSPAASPTISKTSLSSDGIVVTGDNLDQVTSAAVEASGATTALVISEKSKTTLKARPSGKLALVAGVAYRLLIDSASAQTSSSITIEAAAITCPDGWAKITAGGGKSYQVCIEKTATSTTSTFGPAQIACLNKGASLCFANELYALCGQSTEAGATIGATEEWFEAIDSKGASTVVTLGAQPSSQGYFSSCSTSGATTNAAAAARYRCCRR